METISNMSIGQIAAAVIAVVSVFVEIAPIKINPISSLLGWIGRQLTKSLNDKVDTLERKIMDLEKSDIVSCRVRILTFADEIRRGVKHSKETFDQVLSDIDDYERYCEMHPGFLNNKTAAAKNIIVQTYYDCLREDNFL